MEFYKIISLFYLIMDIDILKILKLFIMVSFSLMMFYYFFKMGSYLMVLITFYKNSLLMAFLFLVFLLIKLLMVLILDFIIIISCFIIMVLSILFLNIILINCFLVESFTLIYFNFTFKKVFYSIYPTI